MTYHRLKIQSKYFEAVCTRQKCFEIRKNDRNYKVGDCLILQEIDESGRKTGSNVLVVVTYLLDDFQAGLKDGYCIMSIKILETYQERERQ